MKRLSARAILRSIRVCAFAVLGTLSFQAVQAVSYSLEGAVFDPNSSDHLSNGDFYLSSGQSVTFDIVADTISGDFSGTGTQYADENGVVYSVFNFDSFYVETGASISLSTSVDFLTSRGVAILSRGDLTVLSAIDFSGTNGNILTPRDGANLSLVSNGHLTVDSVSLDGGNGGAGSYLFGSGNGQTGADGGTLTLAGSELDVLGSLSAEGGSGGKGARGFSFTGAADGFDGGNGGRGGTINFRVSGETAFGNVLGGTAGAGGAGVNGGDSGTAGANGSDGSFSSYDTPSYLSATSVPEPCSSLLATLASITLLLRRQREKSRAC